MVVIVVQLETPLRREMVLNGEDKMRSGDGHGHAGKGKGNDESGV